MVLITFFISSFHPGYSEQWVDFATNKTVWIRSKTTGSKHPKQTLFNPIPESQLPNSRIKHHHKTNQITHIQPITS